MNWIRHLVIPLIATLFWGASFVPQELASKTLDAVSVNMLASWLAFFFLLPCSIILDFAKKKQQEKNGVMQALSAEEKKLQIQKTILGGVACGIPMAAASVLQQAGISMSGAGKSGFFDSFVCCLCAGICCPFRKESASPNLDCGFACSYRAVFSVYYSGHGLADSKRRLASDCLCSCI